MSTRPTLDKMYLEYSNITNAKTQKEMLLEKELSTAIQDMEWIKRIMLTKTEDKQCERIAQILMDHLAQFETRLGKETYNRLAGRGY